MGADMRDRYPKLYRHINVERNDAWVPKIEQMLAEPGTDDPLVVVGALHLLGDDGVVAQLREKGYAVERVCTACTDREAARTLRCGSGIGVFGARLGPNHTHRAAGPACARDRPSDGSGKRAS